MSSTAVYRRGPDRPLGDTPGIADTNAVWTAILDRLEADIAVAFSGAEPEPWAPPALPGPIPAELEDRARRVLNAQEESIAILTKTRQVAAAHLEALNLVPASSGAGHALLIDVRG
ncbi:hypothetical protein [Arthrobacter sp. H-02-3]|uniref:hypothetical protein n=1 Tax=Arthrobacter sp. H-02-3 TaxID=2703675 RepID=UPI000DD27801|nr:hypothetical protein [Arthrobacter sp. H-02-3]PVZ56380.1 hypothetical protein C9424_11755 [Arthrobacter sp. H-02-3]